MMHRLDVPLTDAHGGLPDGAAFYTEIPIVRAGYSSERIALVRWP